MRLGINPACEREGIATMITLAKAKDECRMRGFTLNTDNDWYTVYPVGLPGHAVFTYRTTDRDDAVATATAMWTGMRDALEARKQAQPAEFVPKRRGWRYER